MGMALLRVSTSLVSAEKQVYTASLVGLLTSRVLAVVLEFDGQPQPLRVDAFPVSFTKSSVTNKARPGGVAYHRLGPPGQCRYSLTHLPGSPATDQPVCKGVEEHDTKHQ
jgi:hypothetical protein